MVALRLCSGAAIVACAVAPALASSHPLQGPYRETDRVLATRRPHPAGGVDDVRRPGNNGRLWISRGYIGDPEGRFPRDEVRDWGSPGPAAYGAAEDDASTVKVRVDQVAVGINPWESIPEAGYQHLERGREEWLKERGYTGGVRTFTNPVFRREPAAPAPAPAAMTAKTIPEPRAVFELPPDMPRFKKRQEVMAEPRLPRPHTVVVVSTPKATPAAVDTHAGAVAQVLKPPAAPAAQKVKEPALRQVADATPSVDPKDGT